MNSARVPLVGVNVGVFEIDEEEEEVEEEEVTPQTYKRLILREQRDVTVTVFFKSGWVQFKRPADWVVRHAGIVGDHLWKHVAADAETDTRESWRLFCGSVHTDPSVASRCAECDKMVHIVARIPLMMYELK